MNKTVNVLIVVVLIITVSAVVNYKKSQRAASETADANQPANAELTATIEEPAPVENEVTGPLPRLMDLGSTTCEPCKLMAPILEELKAEYAGIFKVQFLDVNTNPILNEEFDIRVIPTQIFYDAEGNELFRHEGFMSKEDILAKWAELGIKLTKAE
jgi:thioredoxin 1